MATGILGLGGSASSGLNQELIDKLKEAERKAQVAPIESKLEKITSEENGELKKYDELKSYVNTLIDSISMFDLFNTKGSNVFEQVVASTTGDSASFEAVDASLLKAGMSTVDVTQLAKRDVYQTSSFTSAEKSQTISSSSADTIDISIGGKNISFSLNNTYDNLVAEINNHVELRASIEKTGDDAYKIVIRSAESGEANKLNISASGTDILGFNSLSQQALTNDEGNYIDYDRNLLVRVDGTKYYDTNNNELFKSDNPDGSSTFTGTDGEGNPISINSVLKKANHVQTAQNMKANIDGIDYNVSSNTITIQGGLNMTAVKIGQSSVNIEKDNTSIAPALQSVVSAYNDLVGFIDGELYNSDSNMQDTTSIRSILSTVKNLLYSGYGDSSDLRIFNYGIEVDKNGKLSLDTKKFGEAVINNLSDLKNLFIGSAENKGLGTILKETLVEMSFNDGILTMYNEGITKRKEALEKEQTKAIEQLDAKYLQLANQFAAYTAIISQMESSFGGLKMMIQQSTASK